MVSAGPIAETFFGIIQNHMWHFWSFPQNRMSQWKTINFDFMISVGHTRIRWLTPNKEIIFSLDKMQNISQKLREKQKMPK